MQLGIDPRIPAAAALAIATGSPCDQLAALLVTDFDPATGTITLPRETTTIPNHLVAPVRAQHRSQSRKGYTHLLAATTRTPAAHSIRAILASRAPHAAAAATRAQALIAYKTAIDCHPLDTLDDPDPDVSLRLHPDSLDRWEEHLRSSSLELAARYGLPVRERGYLDFSGEAHRVDALTKLSGIRPCPLPASIALKKTLDEDVRLLHTVILQYGGKIRRSDLYRALAWTAKRTQTALEQLERHLAPLGETIAEEPPDYLEARAIDHHDADRALQTLRSRAQARDGLSSAAAQILHRLVQAHPNRITALPDEHPDATAQATLCQADIAWIYDGKLALENTVAMTLGNHARHETYKVLDDVG
jgi:hypothetical protein